MRPRGLPFALATIAASASAMLAASCQPAKSAATRAATRDERGAVRASAQTGIELLRWFVPNDPKRRKEGIDRIVAEGLATRIASDLDANGFTLLRADAARLGAALAALGDSASARSTLLGQPNTWVDLASAQLARGTPYFVAGRPAASDEVILRLGLRGWCFPTVDAARARVELRLSEDAARVAVVTIDPSTVRVRSTDIRSGRAALELGPEDALIVLETPVIPPESGDGDGPATGLPPTLAALLLDGRPFPDRASVLVILPSLADILPPQEPATAPAPAPTPQTPRLPPIEAPAEQIPETALPAAETPETAPEAPETGPSDHGT
ncbi:MAG: hypothetical protein RLY21_1760 [Planctomycetota bacterium]|jgi:hypothetical protein